MTDLTLLGIAEAGRLMVRGELTSTDLTEAFLKRIEAVDHKIASYITVTADVARNAARQADMEMKAGCAADRCTAFRSHSRTSTRPPASGRPDTRTSRKTMSRRSTPRRCGA